MCSSDLGIPSFAISLDTFTNPDFSFAAEFARKLAKQIMKQKNLPKGTLLNVNIPALARKYIKGVRVVKQSEKAIEERFDKREDPRKRTYYWLTGEIIKSDGKDGADIETLRKNYVSITPIHCDMTDYAFMEELKEHKGYRPRFS